ncbi:helical backbone metal receptor [Gramella sp. GC03-9]|uniref:Helical backbone metal receptor n=1 Tax=Christiangramia oceanisediminis TaxID=2920386 RepID=A0A9X2I5Q6_9FLAO|nr:helical backbone metal receptor [Gramella oceanisediminis]MCP9198384.1 helical backbone metal receptor [Gramella oceanisediminis]
MKFRDQLNRTIELRQAPRRIVSLVPSQTELIVDLGLEEQLVGITHFCVHPAHLKKTKVRVGGTKKVNLRKVQNLKPDIILCNKEENTVEMVDALEQVAPVHVSDVNDIHSTCELIEQYGKIFECSAFANTLSRSVQKKARAFKDKIENKEVKRVAYFIWKDPLMVAGKGTFIDSMLKLNGFENVFQKTRYPETDFEELERIQPDLILLSSEPFPFKEEHKKEFEAFGKKVLVVDGEFFSWYGSRLLAAFDYFTQMHQESMR